MSLCLLAAIKLQRFGSCPQIELGKWFSGERKGQEWSRYFRFYAPILVAFQKYLAVLTNSTVAYQFATWSPITTRMDRIISPGAVITVEGISCNEIKFWRAVFSCAKKTPYHSLAKMQKGITRLKEKVSLWMKSLYNMILYGQLTNFFNR